MKRKHTKQPAAQVPAPQPRREVALSLIHI